MKMCNIAVHGFQAIHHSGVFPDEIHSRMDEQGLDGFPGIGFVDGSC